MSIAAHRNLLGLRACVALCDTFYAQLLAPPTLKDMLLVGCLLKFKNSYYYKVAAACLMPHDMVSTDVCGHTQAGPVYEAGQPGSCLGCHIVIGTGIMGNVVVNSCCPQVEKFL